MIIEHNESEYDISVCSHVIKSKRIHNSRVYLLLHIYGVIEYADSNLTKSSCLITSFSRWEQVNPNKFCICSF